MQPNMIGSYGPWAASIVGEGPGGLLFRQKDVAEWRSVARQHAMDCLSQPDTGGVPEVTVQRRFRYGGLHVGELSWQLPYGPPTQAVLLKPEGAVGKLPGIVALHDHGGNK